LDKRRVQTFFFRQRSGKRNGLLGKINPGDVRTQARPGERIQAKVALQVEERLPSDLSDFFAFEVFELGNACLEPFKAVGIPFGVNAYRFIPPVQVGFDILIHTSLLPGYTPLLLFCDEKLT
jgi:hypothetical protein